MRLLQHFFGVKTVVNSAHQKGQKKKKIYDIELFQENILGEKLIKN